MLLRDCDTYFIIMTHGEMNIKKSVLNVLHIDAFFENEVFPTTAVQQATRGCGKVWHLFFFGGLINMLHILQIPSGCFQNSSRCFAPVFTPQATGCGCSVSSAVQVRNLLVQ